MKRRTGKRVVVQKTINYYTTHNYDNRVTNNTYNVRTTDKKDPCHWYSE